MKSFLYIVFPVLEWRNTGNSVYVCTNTVCVCAPEGVYCVCVCVCVVGGWWFSFDGKTTQPEERSEFLGSTCQPYGAHIYYESSLYQPIMT